MSKRAAPLSPAGVVGDQSARVLVGKIGAAHGLAGEVRLWPFTGDPLAIRGYGALETQAGRKLVLKSARPAKDFLIARFEGVDDRNAAEALRNVDLFVPRERLPAAAADEFYHSDLIGLRAETAEGVVLGEVAAVHNFGAGDMLEIRRADGESGFLPFRDAFVPVVDIAGGRIVTAGGGNIFEAGKPDPGEED